ncbi:hypothetical protein [Salinicola aestuarinus]|uniref:hypothetical protein n=1 Tax=Salinicola aestuarinus TaxID=1949082 RepID=UPI000DA21EBD|nr:hypothetical protein [Salinicola aestuarinus]
MIQREELQRNSDGMWTHSEWAAFCDQREYVHRDEVNEWLDKHGLEFSIVELESEPEDHPAYISYFDEMDPDLELWEPNPPAGDGWILLSLHDTEDGAVQIWVREKSPAIEAADG